MAARFDPENAAVLVKVARLDSGMSQADLARSAGMSQPHVAAIEAGRRAVSAEVLERVLRAADYRPSIALEEHAAEIVAAGARSGVADIRVFGSAARGSDHFTSDIDLVAKLAPGRSYFDVARFQNDVQSLTGFPVDVVIDGEGRPAFLDETVTVPL